jgi:hypothetical protein
MSRKLTAIGLIIYVLILLTQPCQDVFAGKAEFDRSTTLSALIEKDADNDCGPETCSPFCICSCCSLSLAYQVFTTSINADPAVHARTDTTNSYRKPYDLNFQTNIWQPPKA